MQFTPLAIWCFVIAVVVAGGWALFAERTLLYDEPMVEALCDDHEWEEHPEDPTLCNYWYTGARWVEPCPYTEEQHAVIHYWYEDETREWFIVDEDDMCEGHRTVTGDWSDCGLPVGHRAVPEVDDV